LFTLTALVKDIRQAILDQRFDKFATDFLIHFNQP